MEEFDYSKQMEIGKKVAQSMIRKKKLITFWVDAELREEAYSKCGNLSAFLTGCVERLVQSPIDKQIRTTYRGIAKDTLKETELLDRSPDLQEIKLEVPQTGKLSEEVLRTLIDGV